MPSMNNDKTIESPPYWRQERVLVTGATGLVGSWLVKELLAQGAYVVALVQDADPQSELYRSGDVQRVLLSTVAWLILQKLL